MSKCLKAAIGALLFAALTPGSVAAQKTTDGAKAQPAAIAGHKLRSEEHTSELQSQR